MKEERQQYFLEDVSGFYTYHILSPEQLWLRLGVAAFSRILSSILRYAYLLITDPIEQHPETNQTSLLPPKSSGKTGTITRNFECPCTDTVKVRWRSSRRRIGHRTHRSAAQVRSPRPGSHKEYITSYDEP